MFLDKSRIVPEGMEKGGTKPGADHKMIMRQYESTVI